MVYRIAFCKHCKWRGEDKRTLKDIGACKKCGGKLTYLENWYFRYTYKGIRHNLVGGPTRAMAEQALRKIKLEIYTNMHRPKKEPASF